jgi:hypothetical protein
MNIDFYSSLISLNKIIELIEEKNDVTINENNRNVKVYTIIGEKYILPTFLYRIN